MADLRTVRILSLDGGGMKGYLSNRFLGKFIQTWGINPNELWKYFDVIAGTSVGGIQALGYAFGLSPDDIATFFTNDGKWIFTIRSATDLLSGSINASSPSNRPNAAQKVAILGNNDQIYRSTDEGSNYGSARLKSTLDGVFGTNTLQNVKTNVLITAYNYDNRLPLLFSNIDQTGITGQNESAVNVALATSAAPIYLPPLNLNSNKLIDGGVFQNNPAASARALAQIIKPTATRCCILSLGAGIGETGFNDASTAPSSVPFEDTVKTLVNLIGIGITGNQEAVAKNLMLESRYTLSNLYHYRFQPVLDSGIDTEIDNSDESFISYMDATANQYFNDNLDTIANFIGHLTA